MKKIYADHAATTKLSARALEQMLPYLKEQYHNPSTLYADAREPRKAIKTARENIASLIGAQSEEIYFTSGGTESDNWAIKNAFFVGGNRKKIITSEIEHHAVLNSCRVMERLGYHIVYIPVDGTGIVNADMLRKEIDDDTAMVSIMLVNNEIGTLQNIRELSEISHRCGVCFHTDAVQAVGHIEINVKDMGIDMLSASAHKFNGPKGIGFLYSSTNVELSSYITGGTQERGKRAGTENVAAIVGMAAALKENVDALQANTEYLTELENQFVDGLKKNNIDFILNGSPKKNPGNISVSFPDVEGEVLLHRLDLKGIEVATGSACDSKHTKTSHVIEAIGVPKRYAKGTIRVSLGIDNSHEDVDKIVRELKNILANF